MQTLKSKTIFTCIFLLVPFVMTGTATASILKDTILLSEEQPGREIRILPRQRQNARVDINSIIDVNFSSEIIHSSQFILQPTQKYNATEIQAERIKKLINGMNTWTLGLAKGWEEAQKLTTVSKGSDEYKRLIKSANKNYSLFYNGYKEYEKALREIPEGKERADTLRAGINAALDQGPAIALPELLRLFNGEIVWLNSQIKEITRQALENGNTLGIKMNASFIQKGKNIPMHLPGYDNYASGVPEPYEKLRFEPNEQDKKALSEINAKASDLATSMREVKSLQDGLKIFGTQKLTENYDKLETAINELTSSITALKSVNWDDKKRQVETESQSGLSNLKTEADKEYQMVIASVTYLVNTRNDLTTKLDQLSSSVDSIRDSLENIQKLRQQNNAAEALIVLLNLASQDTNLLKQDLSTVSEIKLTLSGISSLENDLNIKISTLPDTLKIKATSLIDITTKPEIPQIVKAVDDFKDAINSLLKLNEEMPTELKTQLEGASGIELSDVASVNLIPLNSASDTTINIQEAKGREEGDKIHLHAAIYKMKKGPGDNEFVIDGKPLDEYDAYFELTKYGCYTEPGGGVVFISRIKDASGGTSNGQASPTVTWMLHYRSWPNKTNDDGFSENIWGVLKPAIGLHTSTLNFDSANGIQVGAGITFTLFDDLIQFGYGQDLNVTDNPYYWYIGFGIVKFGGGLGVK